MSTKSLLILDIDETLVHAADQQLEEKCDFKLNGFFVYKRPYLQEFLDSVSSDYQLAIWSAGSEIYVKEIVRGIGLTIENLEFVWSRDRCTRRLDPELQEFFYLKDLKKVKRKDYNLDRVLIVENTPRKVQKNYGNAIYVKSFYGTADSELLNLKEYLHKIKDVENIRDLEKRNWRSEIKG